MSGGARRSLIPLSHADLQAWPAPDLAILTRTEQDAYCLRRSAIEMYANGITFDEIKAQTGKHKSEVHRLLKRCLQMAPNGSIQGFHALLSFVRVSGYFREKEVHHTLGGGSGGCSGALSQLLLRLPEVKAILDDLYFNQNTRGTMPEARMPITAIHERFKAELRKRGFTDADWPFNTANCGYKSLWQYFRASREAQAQRAALSRSGVDAARRSPVGNGIHPLLPSIRPYGAVQLDFHKVDCASVIVLQNDYGIEFEIPLSRWHFGLMVEEKFGAALGYCVALELTPSGDSTLEVVSNALSSHPQDLANVLAVSPSDVLINQLMPELAYQGFSILKVDNGWSNAAHEVVNNIISTVGCAINFGPTRAWWRRNLVERIFGELTRRGLQRVPATHGKGPGDTRSNDPNAQAAKFRITLPDLILLFQRCLREHNLKDGEGMQWTSPLKCLQAAFANPNSGFFSQPLPLATQKNSMLMMHVEEVKVCGDLEKNVRPYFNLDRHKHTNEVLANAYWLVGEKLIVYVDRRLARVVHATVKNTGEQLGRMRAAGPWADSDCSWRDRKLMTRAGMAKRYGSGSEDPLELLKQEKISELKSLRKTGRLKSSRTALEVAKIGAQQKRAEQYLDETAVEKVETQTIAIPAIDFKDPFGLNVIPEVGSAVKGT